MLVASGSAVLSIGGVSVALTASAGIPPWVDDPAHRAFLDRAGTPHVELRVSFGPLPAGPWRRLRYAGGRRDHHGSRLWAVSATGEGFVLAIKGPTRRATPARVARVVPDWTGGDLLVRVDDSYSGQGRWPLEFPLDVMLFIGILAHHGGAVVHGAGAIRDGRGFVFAGPSGAGKTTLARWLDAHGYEVVNDERVVVRADGEGVRMYGTPWPGDFGKTSPRSAPLAGLFFLQHAPTTVTLPLEPATAATLLTPRCRLPFWDRPGLAGLLGAIGHVVTRVPCYRLAFAPDRSVLAALERLVAAGSIGGDGW